MSITREQFIASLRKYRGVKFSHQGRSVLTGFDCGGHFLTSARDEGMTELEFLGYASFPTSGKFDELLQKHATFLWEKTFPFHFDGTELLPADFISFDYGDGSGTRHMAAVTGWDGRRYRVIDANPKFGVCEHALAPPFITSKTRLKGWRPPQFN